MKPTIREQWAIEASARAEKADLRHPSAYSWDAVTRAYVPRSDEEDMAMTTFGPLKPTVAAKWPGGCHHCANGAKSCVCPGPRAMPGDAGLKEHVLKFEDTFSAATVIKRAFFPSNDNDARTGDWMQTYTGRRFWPMDPRADEIFIEDIAHALSMQCRYAGHSLRFYSVAEHCVHMARRVSEPNKLWALLHDASEAYLVDVPRPIKPYLTGYKDAENAVMRAVCDQFHLPYEMPAEVHEADSDIIGDEREQNMAPCVAEWYATGTPLGVELQFWSPHTAELYFLDMFRKLTSEKLEVAA